MSASPICNPSSGGTLRSGVVSRALDFQVGRLALAALGLLRGSRRPMIDKPAKIGICVFGSIGDAVISSAIVADLRQQYPAACIVMIVTQSNAGILPLLEDCDENLVIPVFKPLAAILQLRRQRFDLLVDANQWLRASALYCAMAGAKHTVGFRTPGQHRHYSFDSVVLHRSTCHEIENFRALLHSIKLDAVAIPKLAIPPLAEPKTWPIVSAPYIVFHPWAGGSHAALKEWPAENWIDLASVVKEMGYTVVITGGKGDQLKTDLLVEAASRRRVSVVPVAGRLDLVRTARLLKTAAAVVSVNTGVMHIASALSVPLVALHGPTNPNRWGPVGETSTNVVPERVPPGIGVGYLNLGFEFPRNSKNCMGFISVQTVLAAIVAAVTGERSGTSPNISEMAG